MNTINNIKYIILAFLTGIGCHSAEAQSSNSFTQYHLTPVYNSPAEQGATDYFQVSSHYRKQSLSQGQGFETVAISGVYPLYFKDGGRRFSGVSLGLMQENSGVSGMLQQNSIKAGYAYSLPLSQNQQIAFGAHAGYYRRRVDQSKITTNNQYQNGTYDPGYALGEEFDSYVSQALKMDLGVTWYKQDADGSQQFSLGVAAFNVNRANYEFVEASGEPAGPVTYQLYGSLKAYDNNRIQIVPTFRYVREKNYDQLNLGALFQYQLQEGGGPMHENHLGFGAWYSVDNAAVFSLQLAYPSYLVSIGYTVPASSDIEKMQVNNGFEVTIGWRLNKRKGRKAVPKVEEVP